MLLLLLACKDTAPETSIPLGDGLFEQGCPVEGKAFARALVSESERPQGNDAIARPGDVVLLNEHAAWVVQQVEDPQTYVHYGGNVVDAVPVDGCEQAAPETFGEVGYLVGELFLDSYADSSIRMFRGESIEIVNDGADGEPAVVEVHGVDDRFWLVELTLIRGEYTSGREKAPSEPYGMDLTVRYTLHPDSPILHAELLVEGTSSAAGGDYMSGMVLFPSDLTDKVAFPGSEFDVSGLSMDLDVPWVGTSDGTSAHAISFPETNLASTSIAGVSVLVDAGQALDPVTIGPGNSMSTDIAFSVATGDTSEASRLLAAAPTPVDGVVSGDVSDAAIEVWAQNVAGDWELLDRVAIDADGAFSTALDDRGGDWKLRVAGEGRDLGEFVKVTPGETGVALEAPPVGMVTVDVTVDGAPAAARVQMKSDDHRMILYATPDHATWPVPPGTYDVVVTRGWEVDSWTGAVEVPEGDVTIQAALETVVDTSGWTSIDSHIHNEPSADSTVLPLERARTVAAAGLDAIVTTDHEAIVDLSWAADQVGVHFVLGSEVTATFPEHTNAWPFSPAPEHVRGDPVQWYGMGFEGIFEATRDRGAQVIQLNHFRQYGECGILCVLEWDRQGDPSLDDPSRFLIDGGVWSWDFDACEVQNGFKTPFLDPEKPNQSGAFQDWLSFINLGHVVTGMAVTDAHGLDLPGSPRTYLRGGLDDITASTLGGHAVMSSGAFADVAIGEAGPGDTTTGTTLDIHVQALPEIDVTEVLVLANCELLATLEATAPDQVVKLDASIELELDQDAHVVVLGFGENAMPDGYDASYSAQGTARFIANPIFVDLDGDGWDHPGPSTECWTR